MEPNKKSTKRYPPRVTKYTALEFGVDYNKFKKRVSDVIRLRNNGALTDEDHCFLHDDVINLAVEIAKGWWNNAALRKNPGSRWTIEDRAQQIQKDIVDAFTSKYYEENSEENS